MSAIIYEFPTKERRTAVFFERLSLAAHSQSHNISKKNDFHDIDLDDLDLETIDLDDLDLSIYEDSIDNDYLDFSRPYVNDDSWRGETLGAQQIENITYRDLSDIMAMALLDMSEDSILQTLVELETPMTYGDVESVEKIHYLTYFEKVLERIKILSVTRKEK